jgi:hypothetical protein
MSNFNSENFVKKFGFSILDAIVYSVLGLIILVFVIELQLRIDIDTIKELFYVKQEIKSQSKIVFACDYGSVSLGGMWILPSLFISHFIGNLFFEKTTKLLSSKWMLIIISSSALPIILATVFLPFLTELPIRIDFVLFFWLFFALLAFAFFYAKFPLLIERFRNKNSLK